MIVDKLKKSIIESAISGNLTKQIKEEVIIDTITTDVLDYPFDIPFNWKWVKLIDICDYGINESINGNKIGNNTWILELEDIEKDSCKLLNKVYSPERKVTSNKNIFKKGNLLYGKLRPYLNKCIIADEDGCCSTEIVPMSFVQGVIPNYIKYVLISPYFLNYVNEKSFGTKMPRLGTKDGQNALIPLPPIEEQKRIINKVEELFSKLDEIQPIEEELNNLKISFPSKFRNSIMLNVLQGKLTKQNEKENVNNIISRLKKVSNIINEVPFEIPNNWFWIKFGELVKFEIGKTPPRANSEYWSNNYNWVSISDMIENGYINETKESVSEKAYNDIFKGRISKKGTLLMSFKLTVGRCSILNIDSFHNEGIISIYPYYDDEVLKQYLFRILPFMTKYGDTKGAIKGNTLNSKSLDSLLIPLPPIEEQKRIITKLDKLLPLCDDIEKLVNE